MKDHQKQTSQKPYHPQSPPRRGKDSHQIQCHLQRSTRYHKARERFFTGWFNLLSIVSLLGGSAVFVGILASGPAWLSAIAGTAVAFAQAMEQVCGISKKAMQHNGLASEFTSLERHFHMADRQGEADLDSIYVEILSLEMREPPIKRYLDLICHNQVAVSIGSNDLVDISFWQRCFAQFLNGDGALQNKAIKEKESGDVPDGGEFQKGI